MRSTTGRLVGTLLAGAVLALGCADTADQARGEPGAGSELTPIEDPGSTTSPFAASYGRGTGDGDDLVIISPGDLASPYERAGPYEAALRRDDGTWWRLPPVPFDGPAQLATAGDRAVVGGIACTTSDCSEGELAFAILAEDRSAWVPLEAPDVELSPTETEMTTSPGPSPFAEFWIGPERYLIDDRGGVDTWSPTATQGPPGSTENGCFAGDRYVSVHTNFGTNTVVGDVYIQQVGRGGAPVSAGPMPGAVVPGYFFCAGGELVVENGVAQATLDVGSARWEFGPSNLAAVGGSTLFLSPITGRLANSPDKTTSFVNSGNAGVLRRTGPGVWEPTGVVGHVFATGASVLVIADQDQNVTAVWPNPPTNG